MLWLEHYNNGVTPEAQLKLLQHSGEGLGHQSNTGVINVEDSLVNTIFCCNLK